MTERVDSGNLNEADRWEHDPRGLGLDDFKRALETRAALEQGIVSPSLATRAFLSTLRGAAKIDVAYIVPISRKENINWVTRDGAEAVQQDPEIAPNLGRMGRSLLNITLCYSYPAEEKS